MAGSSCEDNVGPGAKPFAPLAVQMVTLCQHRDHHSTGLARDGSIDDTSVDDLRLVGGHNHCVFFFL